MARISRDLRNKVALVTGASRGIGKGAALELGTAGATVYITARSLDEPLGDLPGTSLEAVAEITKGGGRAVAIKCDHSNDNQVRSVIEKITIDEGRLDILVNNVFQNSWSAAGPFFEGGRPFWEAPLSAWEEMMNVGLRSHFVTTALAMPLLIPNKGLVVNISASGAYSYFYSVHYGIQKSGVDRMIRDMAFEASYLNKPVTFLSLWPGFVNTEFVQVMSHDGVKGAREMAQRVAAEAHTQLSADQLKAMRIESTRFPGMAVVALAADPNVHLKTGRSVSAAGIAEEYGYTDVDGELPDAFALRNLAAWKPLDP